MRLPLVPATDEGTRAGLRSDAAHARFLAGRLPVEVPRAVHLGEPFPGYPGLWSVWTWIEGTSLDREPELDRTRLARDLAAPCVGDPASDLAPAWTVLDEPERSVFREAMGRDNAAWEWGRGWAFEMAVGALHYDEHTNPVFAAQARGSLERLLAT